MTPRRDTGPELLRTAELARALGVDPATVWRWYRRGLISPTTRTVGGQTRWSLDDVRAQVERAEAERAEARGGHAPRAPATTESERRPAAPAPEPISDAEALAALPPKPRRRRRPAPRRARRANGEH